jgi:hypothetical protein
MPLYVFALADAAPRTRAGRGFTAPLALHRRGGVVAIVERRADAPPLEFGALRVHERVVERLSRLVPALLPVRFGTLLDAEELDEILAARGEDLVEALAVVRGRVQFTWRTTARPGRRAPSRPRATARSGADYLRRAARSTRQSPPSFRRAVALRRLAIRERYAPATPLVPDALYHLVDRDRADAYADAAAAVHAVSPGLHCTGPFPPYAFAPELL